MKAHPLVQQATVIGAVFRIDPVLALRGSWTEWNIRLAAVELYQESLPKPKE